MKDFAKALIEEILILDENQKLIGNVVLVDPELGVERYQASFDLEDATYIIEKATEWEDQTNEDYRLATDGEVELFSDSRSEIADRLIELAMEHSLKPGYFVLYGEAEGE